MRERERVREEEEDEREKGEKERTGGNESEMRGKKYTRRRRTKWDGKRKCPLAFTNVI